MNWYADVRYVGLVAVEAAATDAARLAEVLADE